MAVGIEVIEADGYWPQLDALERRARELENVWAALSAEDRAAAALELAGGVYQQAWATMGTPAAVLALVADARAAGLIRLSAIQSKADRRAAELQFRQLVDAVLALPAVGPAELAAINGAIERQELGLRAEPIAATAKHNGPAIGMTELRATVPLLELGQGLAAVSRATGVPVHRVRRVRDSVQQAAVHSLQIDDSLGRDESTSSAGKWADS